ncbi:MAG TPA: PssD/Cps14F family polysaccharide biosynthesis glycosyltransferase [Terriglobia bacterium]|nr:PssD/Cps14F family polysaccharide biosynthesis glycosyltransferase [Terriglobia bacterium]
MTRSNGQSRVKIGLIAARGGHMKQLLFLREAYSSYTCFLVTNRVAEDVAPTPEISARYFVADINQGKWTNPFRLCRIFLQYAWIYWREKPNFIISTGPGIAVPGFMLGRLLGVKTIFIESGARVVSLSHAGRLCYHLSDLFLVQNRALTQRYPRASYHGALYENLAE